MASMDPFDEKNEARLPQKRKNSWEDSPDGDDLPKKKPKTTSDWDASPKPIRRRNRWDETPMLDAPILDSDATPTLSYTATPTPKTSRWDQTPKAVEGAAAAAYTPGVTPFGGAGIATPTPGAFKAITQEENLSDEQLDAMIPSGYKIMDPPAGYKPIRTPARKLLETPRAPFYTIPVKNCGQMFDLPKELPDGVALRPEDYQFFGALMNEEENEELSAEEVKDRRIMKLLLKVKNGTPQQRKAALRQITEKAVEFGAGPLFDRILPLLMQQNGSDMDQERHLLVKTIMRVLKGERLSPSLLKQLVWLI